MKQSNAIVLISLYDIDSFAIRTLHAVLKKAGFNVNSIFFKRENLNNTMNPPTGDEIKTLTRLVKEFKPLFVGISVRSTLFKLACEITKEIKKEVNTLVVFGGIHSTIRPEQCIRVADIVCIGEGEGPIVELAIKLSKGEKIDNIQSLWVKKEDKIIKNDVHPLIQELDSLPFPDFSNENKFLVEMGRVLPLIDPDLIATYCLMTSRGCPFSCTYCCNNTLRRIFKGKGKYVRRRTVENVIEELVQAKKMFKNLTYIVFFDDVFTFDINWIRKFCEEYKNAVNLPFFFYCHPKATNEEIMPLLKDTGAMNTTMGIQTGSEEIRHKYFERYDTSEEIIKASQILHKHKINCAYDVILDNPLETEEDKRETFNLLLRLPRPFRLHTHTLTHFPETKLTNLLLEKGIISENDVEDEKQTSYERWTPTLDLGRNKENLFWDNLYYLTQKKYIPKRFVIWLSHVNFLKRHPKALTFLLRSMSPNIYTVRRGSKIDMIRWYLMSFPHYFLQKKAWLLLWAKIKEKLYLISNPKSYVRKIK